MGRKAKPWYREGHGAWYATVNGRRTHLITGPMEETRAEAHEAFRRLTGTAPADPRIDEIAKMLTERPEWVDVVRLVLGVREDVADYGRAAGWYDLVRETLDGLADLARGRAESSNRLEPDPPAPPDATSPPTVTPPPPPVPPPSTPPPREEWRRILEEPDPDEDDPVYGREAIDEDDRRRYGRWVRRKRLSD